MDPVALKIKRDIRRILARHYIEAQRLTILPYRDEVTLQGWLTRPRGAISSQGPLTPAIVDLIFKEIGRISEIRRVNSRLENWVYGNGGWHLSDHGRKEAAKRRRG